MHLVANIRISLLKYGSSPWQALRKYRSDKENQCETQVTCSLKPLQIN